MNLHPSPLSRINGLLRWISWTLLLVTVVVYSVGPQMKIIDFGWHLAQGRWMVQHGQFYSVDHFNYPNLGRDVVNEYPFFQIVQYAFWCLGDFGPSWLNALFYGVLVFTIGRSTRFYQPVPGAAFILLVALSLLFIKFTLRPHAVTYLGVIFFGHFLLKNKDMTFWWNYWPLFLFQVLWVNSHSGFVLGPALVGLFALEMIGREIWKTAKWPWSLGWQWSLVIAVDGLSCLINPYGFIRLGLAFYQQNMPILRAFVSEMQPVPSSLGEMIPYGVGLGGGLVLLLVARNRGGISWSMAGLTLLFYELSQPVQKHWPVFGILLALTGLSTFAFSRLKPDYRGNSVFQTLLNVLGYAAICPILVLLIYNAVTQMGNIYSPLAQWREYQLNRCELPTDAVRWMRNHKIEGRLFHRADYGGLLQQEGYVHGEVFSDAGFGKFDEDFIHESCIASDRSAAVPLYLRGYQPDFVVCGNFSPAWPYYLKKEGWRLIYYSPNGSVWTLGNRRSDLPTVSEAEIIFKFRQDLTYGIPLDLPIHGRNLIALNSLGLDEGARQLQALPSHWHQQGLYWNAAYWICFSDPKAPEAIRHTFLNEAENSNPVLPPSITEEFRAYAWNEDGQTDKAFQILENEGTHSDAEAELFLRLLILRGEWERALNFAKNSSLFDLRNGNRWALMALCEEHFHKKESALKNWNQALSLYPDLQEIRIGNRVFKDLFDDEALKAEIVRSRKIHGLR